MRLIVNGIKRFMENFRISKNENVESKFYTLKEYQDFQDNEGYPRNNSESQHTFAKAVKDRPSKHLNQVENFYSFYIKTDPNKKVFDPRTRYSIDPKIPKNFLNSVCKSNLQFTKVTQQMFNDYISFLKTENSKWLAHVQREIK